MKKKKTLKIILITAAALLVVAGILVLIRIKSSSGTVDVYSVANISYYDYEYGSTTSAMVSDGQLQTVTLRDGLVESINVKVGDTVKKGDPLMKYDETSYQLILQKDQADIAVLESNVNMKKNEIAEYRLLKPSEEAPEPTEETVDHGALNIIDTLEASDATVDGSEFYCSTSTVMSSGFLQALRSSGLSVVLKLYDNDTCYGCYVLDGAKLPSEHYEYTQSETSDSSGNILYMRTISDPLNRDIALSEICSVMNEQLVINTGSNLDLNGSFTACTPEKYERYETVIHYPDDPANPEDYVYSAAELSRMVSDGQKELKSLELSLQQAQITYQKDQLENVNGVVYAEMDGEVTEVKALASVGIGETLITVKGDGTYGVVAYVSELSLPSIEIGDALTVTTYSTGSTLNATVSEIGTTPLEDNYYGNNPDSSYYPVQAIVNDWDVAPEVGDYGDATFASDDEESSAGFYLSTMYVRDDEQGRYVYVMNDSGKLEKRYINTGKILWGWEILVKDGLTQDEYIAFPYGKYVKEGAATNISDEWL